MIFTSFLDEGTEGSNAGARANHDDGDMGVLRKSEIWVVADEYRTCVPHCQSVLQVGGADSSTGKAQQLVPHHCSCHTYPLTVL